MGIKSRQRRRQQAAGRASAGNAGVPRGFNPRTGEFDGTGMSQDEILALYEELAAEERRRQRGGRVRYSEGNAVMKLWNGVYRLVAVVAVVLIASFTQLFPTAEAYDRRRGQDPNARFGDDAGDEGAENVGGAGGSGPEKTPRDEPAKPTDPFETLGLDKSTATADDVAKAFKRMAIKWHPDKNLDREEEAKHMMQTINAARARCVQILEGGKDPEERDDAEFDPTKPRPEGDDDDASDASDDDVGGADCEAKARRRAERAHRRMYEEMQRDYERRRRQERQRVRAEARQPGARFKRQRDAHAARARRSESSEKETKRSEDADGADAEAGSEPNDSNPADTSGGSANRSGKGSSTNRKKNRARKDKSRFAERGETDEEDDRRTGRKRLGGVESCAERMDACVHEIALAVRAHAPTLLAELLMFECPPLAPVDPDGNTPLHYVARYDPGLVEAFLQVVGEGWRAAATAKNNHGQTPVDMLSPEVEDLDEKTAAQADRVDSVKGTSPAAVEERERLEKQARERAEASRLGAERIRKITGYAQREEEKRRVLTRRTFDARGAARVSVAATASCATAYFVVWTGVWGAWVWAAGVFFATAVFALDRLVPREQVAEFAGNGDGEGDGAAT